MRALHHERDNRASKSTTNPLNTNTAMAECGLSPSLVHDLHQWVLHNITDDLQRAQRLTNEDSRGDPPEEPYRSLYAARELLSGMKAKLDSCPQGLQQLGDYRVLCACSQLQLGLNYTNTEEPRSGEKAFETCLQLLDGIPDKARTASVSVQAYNQLGVLWGNRGEQQKALEYLLKAKAVYESHIALPSPLTEAEWLLGESVSEWDREKAFESLHTHTLFYLAQVYGNLNQAKLSAEYCQTTLSRQLETREFDHIEWSLNCATLSQYYLNVEHYAQARHCLACASCVLAQCSEGEGEVGSGEEGEMGTRVRQVEADISRCWSKYCIGLLRTSREGQEGGGADRGRQKVFRFDTLEVNDVEGEVSCEVVESYDGAKPVFVFGQKHLETAKKYYSLDDYASDYVAVVQDHSLLFKLLAYFESDNSLKCRMHKRRIDMLSEVLSQLNPQHYLMVCRQLMFELGETHSEMADLKIVTAADSPSPHAVGKINKMIRSGIQLYLKFVGTFADASGQLPESIDDDFLRPILSAKLYIARLYSKLIDPDPAGELSHLRESLAHYQWLVSYHEAHPAAVERVFGEEVELCREMVHLIPLKINLCASRVLQARLN